MVGFSYSAMRAVLVQLIAGDPTTVTFYGRGTEIEATGRLAPAGSRTFGRIGVTRLLDGTEPVGKQLHVLELPYNTQLPAVGNEARTVRQSVEQRFTVVTVLPSPWKVEVILDELQ